MGDRGNIAVKHPQGEVWLYTHWGGSDIPEVVQSVLARKLRWEDETYLTRMLFCKLIGGDIEGETGYGIGPSIGDNEHKVLVVDVPEQKVRLCSKPNDGGIHIKDMRREKSWTFAKFAELKELPSV